MSKNLAFYDPSSKKLHDLTDINRGLPYFVEVGSQTFRNDYKRGSLLENEEIHLGGDSPIFEIIYTNLEQRSIFS